ncbi:hypothetical protein MRB53_038035 [Persea americana]|nr:hypothetical protein MRB53_038035 [Persea americana]
MASLLLRPRPLAVGLSLGLTSLFASRQLSSHPRYLLCDAPAYQPSSPFEGYSSYTKEARTPVVTSSGRVNPKVYRQLSAGSIAGLAGGILVGVFSKPLALLIGILVLGAQGLESWMGVRVLPYERLGKMARGINVRSVLEDDVAFKVSFGSMFVLAAFAKF